MLRRLLLLCGLASGALAAFQDAAHLEKADDSPTPAAQRGPPIVGAIRWDAYFATPGTEEFEDKNFGVVSRATTGDMSAKKWHYRLPFFGKEVNDTAVVVNGNSADIMGQELEYAAQHGINFWPFCNYPIGCTDYHPPDADCAGIQCCADNVGLSYAWNQYLAHPDNHKVNFTLLLQPGYWFHGQEAGSNETWPEELARYMTYFKMPNYQRVDIGEPGRPLVFSFGRGVNQSHLQDFRAATKKAVGVEPYFVSMNNQKLPQIDAQSAYGSSSGAPQGGPTGTPYVSNLADVENKLWATRKAQGLKQIPTVSAGADARPRSEYPMPWGGSTLPGGKHSPYWGKAWVKDPTMEELENHVTDGLKFVSENPDSAETNMMLLSAWNEHDEGHWIEPALEKYGGAEKLEAIKKAIDKAKARRRAYWATVGGE